MTAPIGPLAGEAAQLLDVVAERLTAIRDRSPAGDGESGPAQADAASGDEPAGRCPECGHDPAALSTCTACPLCKLLALLRGERPEATARLVDGALALVQVLRGLVPEPGGATPQATSPQQTSADDAVEFDDTTGESGGDAAPAGGASPAGGLERIDIR